MAQKEYKRRHHNVAKVVHWELAGKCGFQQTDKWFEHVPEGEVLDDEGYKILWNFNIQTDHGIEAIRPDIIVANKQEKNCQIIEEAIPEDTRVMEKEEEKAKKNTKA